MNRMYTLLILVFSWLILSPAQSSKRQLEDGKSERPPSSICRLPVVQEVQPLRSDRCNGLKHKDGGQKAQTGPTCPLLVGREVQPRGVDSGYATKSEPRHRKINFRLRCIIRDYNEVQRTKQPACETCSFESIFPAYDIFNLIPIVDPEVQKVLLQHEGTIVENPLMSEALKKALSPAVYIFKYQNGSHILQKVELTKRALLYPFEDVLWGIITLNRYSNEKRNKTLKFFDDCLCPNVNVSFPAVQKLKADKIKKNLFALCTKFPSAFFVKSMSQIETQFLVYRYYIAFEWSNSIDSHMEFLLCAEEIPTEVCGIICENVSLIKLGMEK